ncbi:MAG: RNA chaperone Hfq [Cytophagales bacterium]|nr:RNA chaperone Hfq [Armatimonadota bacterium]
MDLGIDRSRDRAEKVLLSESQMIRYRDERKVLTFALVGGGVIEGAVRWFDSEVIHVVDEERNEMTLFKHAIQHYRAK